MFIAVASAAGKQGRKRDVNEILDSGAGWTKGLDGYKYDVPAAPLKAEPVEEVVVEEVPEVAPEIVQDVVEVVGKIKKFFIITSKILKNIFNRANPS